MMSAPSSSARVASEPPASNFDALSETLAKLGAVEPAENYPADAETKLSGSGYSEKLSGSGYRLPDIENVQWESNGLGGFEAWHVPAGVTHRAGKTYLGFLGKRRLASWQKEPPDKFRELVTDWIAEKRREKQIE